ncbi:MAG: hypothetical protein K5665_04775 [Saccharofermentans sp.]|nr:hypothetical protein [Saccharofermentans sp.]
MRKTYAYNGITLGILFGIAAWAATSNGAVGIAVAVAGSVICFIVIRAIENAIYKGAEKAGEAITRKLDESHKNKTQGQAHD